MSFNGNGVFTLIAGNPVVTGTVISSTWANNTLTDIANGLTNCIAKDGQSTPTNNIPLGSFKLTGLANGTNAQDAVTFSQLVGTGGIVGSARNLKMATGASATATWSCDEMVVETVLGGQAYRISGFSQALNLATTGTGGMDTGVAPTSGYVAVYAIYNPSTNNQSILGKDTTIVKATEVYSGANMPAGYTASALISVMPTNASKQFIASNQFDRSLQIQSATAVSSLTQVASLTTVNIAAIIPINANAVSGQLTLSSNNATNAQVTVSPNTLGSGTQQLAVSGASAGSVASTTPFKSMKLVATQTIFWSAVVGSGTFQAASVLITGYDF